MTDISKNVSRATILLILVSALGYFVDVYDLLLFSVVRQKSLLDLGIAAADSLNVGLKLLNIQMAGMLIGGVCWGILGDKRGRISVLFGSIILYSIANLLNAYITTLGQYEILRFVAGFGLAGELGAGITLVCETMTQEKRGIGTMFVTATGFLGAVAASLVSSHVEWRTAFLIGGIMGLVLLAMRFGLYESGLYKHMEQVSTRRGAFLDLFKRRDLFFKYLKAIGTAIPCYFTVAILVTAAPEIGKVLGLTETPTVGVAVMMIYIASSIGGILSMLYSQVMRSRKKALYMFHLIGLGGTLLLFLTPIRELPVFYTYYFILGLSLGYWSVSVTAAAENFGTNIRATVTTSAPNMVRGATIPITFAFAALKNSFGMVEAGLIVGCVVVALALLATWRSAETFGRDLDFVE